MDKAIKYNLLQEVGEKLEFTTILMSSALIRSDCGWRENGVAETKL